MKKKVISTILAFTLLIGALLPALVSSANAKEDPITVTANSESPITIQKTEDDVDIFSHTLNIAVEEAYSIDRDYSQSCLLSISNTGNKAVEYYMAVENHYPDISVNFIKGGSEQEPLLIQPGEEQEVELAVFSQNAENSTYKLPVRACIEGQEEADAQNIVILNCKSVSLDVSCVRTATDASTLTHTYTLKNLGERLTDVSVSVSGDAQEYTRIDPIISNLEIDRNTSVTFKAVPDLAKMKENQIAAVAGKIVVSGGGNTREFDLEFDTHGQEITNTTMGELALRQDGNPFVGMEIDKESVQFYYIDGIEKVVADENTSLDVLLNNEANIGYTTNYILENGTCMETETTIKATEYIGDRTNIPSPCIEIINGNLVLKSTMLVSADEYHDMLGQSDAIRKHSIIARNSPADIAIEVSFQINDIMSLPGIDLGSETWRTVGNIVDFAEWCYDTGDTVNVWKNPNYSNDVKNEYTTYYLLKTLAKEAVLVAGLINPVAGVVVGIGSWLFEKWMDKMQDNLLAEEERAALLQQIMGEQCTNRGLIPTDFYIPNYRADKSKTSMYTTSRMYSGNHEPINGVVNYVYLLNGQEAGTSSSDGLTELAIAQLPTEHLKFGENNKLIRDYDTNPGSYQVSTDTEITIIYPPETEIGYIGTPEELQDIRIKPDFAVYSENIYCEEDVIVGDQTKVKFNVYNRGSSGGWVNIQVTDETGTVFNKKNYYMDAFTGESFEFNWIPSQVSSSIQVTLTNTSVGLEERKDDNNMATRTIKARQRAIPQIIDLNASVADYGKNVTLLTNISDYMDVERVSFYIDNQVYTGSVHSGTVGGAKRFWTESVALEPGDHAAKVVVTYASGKTSTSDIEQYKAFQVEAKKYQVPSIGEIQPKEFLFGSETCLSVDLSNATDVKSVEFLINNDQRYTALTDELGASRSYCSTVRFNKSGMQTVQTIVTYFVGADSTATIQNKSTVSVRSFEESVFSFSLSGDFAEPEFELIDGIADVQDQENGNYVLWLTPDMYSNPEDHHLFITANNGFLFTDLTNRDVRFSAEDCQKLKFTGSSDFEVYEIRLLSVNEIMVETTLNYSEFLYLLPGKYEFDISYSCYGAYTNSRCQVVIDDQDVTIDLSDNLRQYNYSFEDQEVGYASAELYYRDADAEYWNGTSLSTMFDYEKRTLSCVINDTYTLEKLENASEALMVVYTQDSVFINRIKPETRISFDMVLLDKNNLRKLTVNTDQGQSVQVHSLTINNDLFNISLNSNVVYLPQDEYEISAECKYNENQSIYKQFAVNMDKDQFKTIEVEVSSLTVNWPSVFGKRGSIYGNGTAYQYFNASDYTKNSIVRIENGDYIVYTTLYCGNSNYGVYSAITAVDGENHISIGQSFSGVVSFYDRVYSGKEVVYFSLENLFDMNRNQLSYFWSSEELYNLTGYIEFTNTENHKESYKVPLSLDSIYSLSVELPNIEGTFDVAVSVSTSEGSGVPIDKATLEQAVYEARDIVNDNYTEESWRLFSEALRNAEDSISNPDATQEDIDIALYNLETAIQHLTKQEESTGEISSTEEPTEDITTSQSTMPSTQAPTVPEDTTDRIDQTTVDPSQSSTASSTEVSSEKPTVAPTAEPTQDPTVKPSVNPTSAPATKPNEPPTAAPTMAPETSTAATAEKTTAAPTTAENAENPDTGESTAIVAACSVLTVVAGAAVVLTRKKKGA